MGSALRLTVPVIRAKVINYAGRIQPCGEAQWRGAIRIQVCPCIAYEAANTPNGTAQRKTAKKLAGMLAATVDRDYHRSSRGYTPPGHHNNFGGLV